MQYARLLFMNRVLRTFLLWLLVLALPVQGYAAATMPACGTIQSHDPAEITSAFPHEHDATTRVHTHQGHHPDSAEQVAHGDHSASISSAQHADSTCSTCQSCCFGLGIIAQNMTWQLPSDNAQLPAAAPIVSYTGFIPQGLERPPRTLVV